MNKALCMFVAISMLLAMCCLPRFGREVPTVVFDQSDLHESSDNVVLCSGCNPLIFGEPLNINSAPVEHLILLPRIGPKRAEQIVAMRESVKFAKMDDLTQVRGIGPKTIVQLTPFVVFE